MSPPLLWKLGTDSCLSPVFKGLSTDFMWLWLWKVAFSIHIGTLYTSVWYPLHLCLVSFTPLSGTLYTSVWYPLHLCLVPFTTLSGNLYTSVWYPLHLCLVTFTPLSGTLYTSVWTRMIELSLLFYLNFILINCSSLIEWLSDVCSRDSVGSISEYFKIKKTMNV